VPRLLDDERGLSSVEYVVLLTVIVAAGVAAWNAFGHTLGCKLANASDSFAGMTGGGPGKDRCVEAPASSPYASTTVPASSSSGTNRQGVPDDQPARAPTKPTNSAPNGNAVAKVWTKQVMRYLCPDNAVLLADMQKKGAKVTLYNSIYFEDTWYDGSRWQTKRFDSSGTAQGKEIHLVMNGARTENAATIVHEGTHFQQPAGMSVGDSEYDAYAKEDAWRISKGMPAFDPSFRKAGPGGKPQTNMAGIRRYVDKNYPNAAPRPAGASADPVVGQRNGNAVLRAPNGKKYERAPQQGDSFGGDEQHDPAKGIPVDMADLQC